MKVAGNTDDDEVKVRIEGGSHSEDRKTGSGRFNMTLISDEELSLRERKAIFNELMGTELIIDLPSDD